MDDKKPQRKPRKKINALHVAYREQLVRQLYGEDLSLQDIADFFSWNPTRARIGQILKKSN